MRVLQGRREKGERKGGRAFDSTTLLMDKQYSVRKYDCLPIRGEEAPLLPPKHMYMYLPYVHTIEMNN